MEAISSGKRCQFRSKYSILEQLQSGLSTAGKAVHRNDQIVFQM